MKLAAAALALLLYFPAFAPADEPAAKPPTREELEKLGGFIPADDIFNLHIDVLMVAIPEAEALALLPQLRDAQKIEQACTTIQEMLVTKRAKLLGWPSVITKSGNRAVSENIDEVRYPIEFSGPSVQLVPEDLVDSAPPRQARDPKAAPAEAAKPAAEAKSNELAKATEPAPPVPPKPENPQKKGRDPTLPLTFDAFVSDAIPTTFETRNTGSTLEVEPSYDPETNTIDLSIAPQRVYFAGMDRFAVESEGGKVVVEQPRFRTNKVSTNLTVKNGKPVLLDQFKSGEHPGHLEFFILRATAKAVK